MLFVQFKNFASFVWLINQKRSNMFIEIVAFAKKPLKKCFRFDNLLPHSEMNTHTHIQTYTFRERKIEMFIFVFNWNCFFPSSIDLWNKFFGLSQFIDDMHIFDQNGDDTMRLSSMATTSTNLQSKVFPCIKCGRRYSTRSIMLRHMNHECGMAKKYMCPKCNKKFRRKWNLEQHLKRIHTK